MIWVLGAYAFGVGLIGAYAMILRRRRARLESAIERAIRDADRADADTPW